MALPPHLKKLQETQSSASTQASSVNKENVTPPRSRDRSSENAGTERGMLNGDDGNGPKADLLQQLLAKSGGSGPSSPSGSIAAAQRQPLPHRSSVAPADSSGRHGVSSEQRSTSNTTPAEGMTVREAFSLKQQLDAANARYEDVKIELGMYEMSDREMKDLEREIDYVKRTTSARLDASAARVKKLEADKMTLVETANARAGAYEARIRKLEAEKIILAGVLKMRVDTYEARIRELEAENVALKEAGASSTVATSQSPQKARGRSSTRRTPNLTGYKSSDDEASPVRGREVAIREPSAGPGPPPCGNEQLQIMHEILGKFKEKVEEFEKEQANIKCAVQEAQQLGLNDRLKRLESLAADEDHDVNKAMQAWKVTVDADLERFSSVLSTEAPDGDLAKRFDEHLQRCELRDRQEARIDEAISKDVLHSYYQQLSTAIDNDETRAGSFEGGTDEFWKLRDRCVRRLASFDDCDEASNEARKLWEYNGRRA